jgi:hypothetical protein
MANLKNSTRISYKATYNQISPTATTSAAGNGPTKLLRRAVEKTAFVQSLRIIPQELVSIKDQLSDGANVPADTQTALNAIEQLINDKTATSTLNNATLFGAIDSSTLVSIAKALIAYRQTIADTINKSIADILSAYRNSLNPPAPTPSATGASTTAANLPENVTTQSGKTGTGIPIVTTITPTPARAGTEGELEARGYSAHVAVDESKLAPAAFSPVLTIGPSVRYTPSNSDAIAWAEKYQPELFANLTSQLQPYMGFSINERTAVGGSKALIDLLTTTFASTFDTGALGGTVTGFETRMTVEPVGNLHLERIEMYPAGIERGELVHSVPLAPGETVNVSHKEWSVSEKEFEDIVQDYFEGYSEQGVAEKTDVAMSNESQSEHATALNVGSSLSASYSSVTLSTDFGYNATSNDSKSTADGAALSVRIDV